MPILQYSPSRTALKALHECSHKIINGVKALGDLEPAIYTWVTIYLHQAEILICKFKKCEAIFLFLSCDLMCLTRKGLYVYIPLADTSLCHPSSPHAQE